MSFNIIKYQNGTRKSVPCSEVSFFHTVLQCMILSYFVPMIVRVCIFFAQDSVTYRIPSEGARWSSMFRKIENNKERFGIINYSVSQTTLDQVILNAI